MVLNDLVDSFCYSQKNAGLKGLKLFEILKETVHIYKYRWVVENHGRCPWQYCGVVFEVVEDGKDNDLWPLSYWKLKNLLLSLISVLSGRYIAIFEVVICREMMESASWETRYRGWPRINRFRAHLTGRDMACNGWWFHPMIYRSSDWLDSSEMKLSVHAQTLFISQQTSGDDWLCTRFCPSVCLSVCV